MAREWSISAALAQYATRNNATGTDKTTSHAYGPLYDALFAPLENTATRVLELGVYSGASVLAFADYFRGAEVTGVDIALDRVRFGSTHPRIRYVHADVTDERALLGALGDGAGGGGREYDLILDDASHLPEDQAKAFSLLARLVSPRGLYVIEDIDGGCIGRLFPQLAAVAERHGMAARLFDLRAKTGQFDDVVFVASKAHIAWDAITP